MYTALKPLKSPGPGAGVCNEIFYIRFVACLICLSGFVEALSAPSRGERFALRCGSVHAPVPLLSAEVQRRAGGTVHVSRAKHRACSPSLGTVRGPGSAGSLSTVCAPVSWMHRQHALMPLMPLLRSPCLGPGVRRSRFVLC